MKAKTGRAKMPWDGDNSHTKLSDGRIVLRGSREEAIDRYGEELVRAVHEAQRKRNPVSEEVEAVQTAVVAAINTLGENLAGSDFVPINSSPIPDDEVAKAHLSAKGIKMQDIGTPDIADAFDDIRERAQANIESFGWLNIDAPDAGPIGAIGSATTRP